MEPQGGDEANNAQQVAGGWWSGSVAGSLAAVRGALSQRAARKAAPGDLPTFSGRHAERRAAEAVAAALSAARGALRVRLLGRIAAMLRGDDGGPKWAWEKERDGEVASVVLAGEVALNSLLEMNAREALLKSPVVEAVVSTTVAAPGSECERDAARMVVSAAVRDDDALSELWSGVEGVASALEESGLQARPLTEQLAKAAGDAVGAFKRSAATDSLAASAAHVRSLLEEVAASPSGTCDNPDTDGVTGNMLYLAETLHSRLREREVLEQRDAGEAAFRIRRWDVSLRAIEAQASEKVASESKVLASETAERVAAADASSSREDELRAEDDMLARKEAALTAQKEQLQAELGRVEAGLYKARKRRDELLNETTAVIDARVAAEVQAAEREAGRRSALQEAEREQEAIRSWRAFLARAEALRGAMAARVEADATYARTHAGDQCLQAAAAHAAALCAEAGHLVQRVEFCSAELASTRSVSERGRSVGVGVEAELDARAEALDGQRVADIERLRAIFSTASHIGAVAREVTGGEAAGGFVGEGEEGSLEGLLAALEALRLRLPELADDTATAELPEATS